MAAGATSVLLTTSCIISAAAQAEIKLESRLASEPQAQTYPACTPHWHWPELSLRKRAALPPRLVLALR
jgi:hypothetical protein